MTGPKSANLPGASGAAAVTSGPRVADRRFESRHPVTCDLWMIDHYGSTVLRCHCTEVSDNGMRLRVPLGYGVSQGQRYELRSHLPGTPKQATLGLVGSRWATVVRTELQLDECEHHLDVGVVLDTGGNPLTRSSS